MPDPVRSVLTKVPAVTLGFWAIKILATTFGETAGDTASMSMDLGYLAGTGIFATLLIFLVGAQVAAKRFHPSLYWWTIVASTTAGTTMADFVTRTLGIGYPGGSILLLSMVFLSLALWHRALGSISVDTVYEPKAEICYWLTITLSQTLGTALGDWVADGPLGYLGSAVVFGGLLALIALAYCRSTASRVALFWAAFILTRPLGAVIGDFLDKPTSSGGLSLSRPGASLVIGLLMVTFIYAFPQRAAAKRSLHEG